MRCFCRASKYVHRPCLNSERNASRILHDAQCTFVNPPRLRTLVLRTVLSGALLVPGFDCVHSDRSYRDEPSCTPPKKGDPLSYLPTWRHQGSAAFAMRHPAYPASNSKTSAVSTSRPKTSCAPRPTLQVNGAAKKRTCMSISDYPLRPSVLSSLLSSFSCLPPHPGLLPSAPFWDQIAEVHWLHRLLRNPTRQNSLQPSPFSVTSFPIRSTKLKRLLAPFAKPKASDDAAPLGLSESS